MSFNFGCGSEVPGVDEALRQAYRHGVIAVASVGNLGSEACVAPPATEPAHDRRRRQHRGRLPGRLLAGGQRRRRDRPRRRPPLAGCPSISLRLDLPGDPEGGQHRVASASPSNYVGTSMAAAHVSGVAAMVLASGTVEPKRTARAGWQR